MAQGEFTCKKCKKKLSPKGIFGASNKFKCSKHGEFCRNCIDNSFLSGRCCPKCQNKLTTYEFKDSYGKWMKV